jgi:hypothetical protein
MPALTPVAARFLLLASSAAASLMTFTGFLFLVVGRLLTEVAHIERFIGEIDGLSIALVFAGIAVALKTMEHRLRAQQDYPQLD